MKRGFRSLKQFREINKKMKGLYAIEIYIIIYTHIYIYIFTLDVYCLLKTSII